ncbi:MAG: hypothetical protein K5787_01575 [Lentisphaeria bacterium]|nr:hypothetical protein [Lentisphaeria bacterium]
MKRQLQLLLCLVGIAAVLKAEENRDDTVWSAAIRLDARTSTGGRLCNGTERISPVAAEEDAAAALKADNAVAVGWSVANPFYATTKLEDDWHAFSLKEGTKNYDVSLLTLNSADIVVHEGVLSTDETWGANQLHIVRHWVRVPEGVTLTIESQAVVKFCEDTGIHVDGTLKALNTDFTVIDDDTLGGDTDLNETAYVYAGKIYNITGNGVIEMTSCNDRLTYELGETDDSMTSATIRLDVRSTTGGRMLHRLERISPAVHTENENPELKIGGAVADDWSSINPMFDSTVLFDGWHDFSLEEGDTPYGATLIALNGKNVMVHEGVLSQDETWTADKIHIVRHWVRVPVGITLIIESQAVVKFCEDTGIQVDGTLTALNTDFTVIDDDTLGGDTDLNGTAYVYVNKTYNVTGSGVIETTSCNDRLTYDLGETDDSMTSATIRLDARSSFGGHLLYAAERISPVADTEDKNAKLIIDETAAVGWSVSNPIYTSTALADGWHDFALTEDEASAEARLITLNGNGISVHEGVMTQNETWTAEKVHVVRHWVRVPKNVTLTIESNAVVKFCEDTGIQVDEGGALKAANTMFTVPDDDTVGGDTDFNGSSYVYVPKNYDITGKGEIEWSSSADHSAYELGRMYDSASSASIRLDVRTTVGGSILHDTERISPVAEEEKDTAILTMDGGAVEGWSISNPLFASADIADGCHRFALEEGGATFDANLLALNGRGVVVHEGILEDHETWSADDVHVVRHWVRVPENVILTIDQDAIVKFCEETGIQVDDGGLLVAAGAVFTVIADDSAGGDTNDDGNATSPVSNSYTLPAGFEAQADGKDKYGNEIRYVLPPVYTGGTIKNGETKILAGNRVHQVTGNITIASGGKLIVQPGAIVKMNARLSITVQNGGELEAMGNRAQPIVFTSIKDDANGWGNNGKIMSTDCWQQITVQGTANMDYCKILYATGSNNQGAIYINGGEVNFGNGEISHIIGFDCVRSYGTGRFTNSVFSDASMGFAPGSGNNTIVNCIFYDITTMVRWSSGTFHNCVFMKATEFIDSKFYSSTINIPMSNCIFWNEANYGGQTSCPKVGSNGNRWADPLFTDPENGDFTLKAGSPCIDAGDGTVAPTTDYWGSPRMNVAKIADSGIPNTDGICPDIGIYEMPGVGGGSMPDLSVSDVAFESKAYREGDVMTVTWQDVNSGDAAAIGPWRDVVSFVRKEEQVTYVVEAASVTVPATLKSGRSQSMSASFRMPALLPGEWQIQVAANQYRDVFEGESGESNILLSEETFTVEMDGIPVGNSSFQVASDSQKTFMLTGGATNGAVLRLTAANGAELSVTASAGRIPTEDDFHWRGVNVSDGQWIVEIPKGTVGDVFVTVANNGDGSANVSVQRSNSSATIFGTDVSEVANGGMASIVIYGAGLDKAAAAELGTVSATNIHVLSSMELVASFDLSDMPIGDYQLTVTLEGGRVLTMDGAIAISQGAIGPKLMAGFSMPETLRPGRWYSGTITYRNDGDRDAIAPLLYLTGNNVMFLDTDDGFTEHTGHIVLVGLASDGDPSVIRPGKTYTVNVKFKGTAPNASSVGIHFTFLDPNEDELKWNMLLGGDNEMFAKRKADLEADFGTPLGLLKTAYEVCGHCSQYGRPMLDVLSVMEKLAAKPDDVEYGYVSGVMVSRDDGQALANCSLVVDGGENDVCYVKTDGGGRFCAWGVPVGRTVTFGGPEGFYYFADGEVTLSCVQKSGVSIYRLAEDNSTPQKTHTIADYKLVKDSDGVVWMIWLADDVLYAALADDPEHTTVSLPSDVKWKGFQIVSLNDGGFRILLRTDKQRNSAEDEMVEILYTCIASMANGKISFSDFKRFNEFGHYADMQICLGADSKLIGAWIDRFALGTHGLKMQYFDDWENDWEETEIYNQGITRAKKSNKKTFKIAETVKMDIDLVFEHDQTGPCKSEASGGLEGNIKIDLHEVVIEGNVTGTGKITSECQYYWSDSNSGNCEINLGKFTEETWNVQFDVYAGKKWEVPLGKLSDKRRRTYFLAEVDVGPIFGGGYTCHTIHYRNGQDQTERTFNATIGGKVHGQVGIFHKNKSKKPLGVEVEGSVEGNISYEPKTNTFKDFSTRVSGSFNCGMFTGGISREFLLGQGWLDWKTTFIQLKANIGEKEYTRSDDDYDYDCLFPHEMVKIEDSIDETCLLDIDKISHSCSVVMECKANESNINTLSSSALLVLPDGRTGCWVSREEMVSGYKDSRLLYFEIDVDGNLGEVKRLHNIQDNYVHGAIIPCKLPSGDLAVVYMVSKLDYSGTIADYFESMNTYQVYCIERRNGQWEEPYLIIDHDVKEVVACYDENSNVLRLAWLVETEDGTQTIYAGSIRDKVLQDTQVLSRISSSEYGKLAMIVDGQGNIRTSWIDLEDDSVTARMAVLENGDWTITQYVLSLNDNDELEEEQTRGLQDTIDIFGKTRGSEKVTYEACDYCKKYYPPYPNCDCGCKKKKSEYIPNECKCNRSTSLSHPADCAGRGKCYDCTCKNMGQNKRSCDPNEIVGVTGMGEPSMQRFVRPGDWLDYTVYFENKSTADVPAQEISIDMALNPAVVDMKSLTFGDVVFGNQTVDALNGRKADGTFSVTQKGTRYLVNGEATRDVQTGEIHWYIRSYDASAEENGFFPEAIDAGFLPPNDGTHRGEGHVTFRVKVKDNAPDGAFINAEATIVFDANDPITTSPAWFNWVTTAENPVADSTTLHWDTSDDANGTSYVVNYWMGNPDPTAPETTITFNSDTLTTDSWKLPESLAVGTWYWNVTKTNGDDSSKTSTWSFDILATHTLTVNNGTGGGRYKTNTRVTVDTTPMTGKIFMGWTATGVELSEAELSESRLVFYMPDSDVTLTANYEEERGILLQSGWNLVATPGELLEEDNAALFAELKPFVLNKESMAYIRASLPLPGGEPLWIYSAKRQQVPFIYEDANGVVGGLTDKAGWQLIGVGGKEAVTLDNVAAAWQWAAGGGWKPLEISGGKISLMAGHGYFIYRE